MSGWWSSFEVIVDDFLPFFSLRLSSSGEKKMKTKYLQCCLGFQHWECYVEKKDTEREKKNNSRIWLKIHFISCINKWQVQLAWLPLTSIKTSPAEWHLYYFFLSFSIKVNVIRHSLRNVSDCIERGNAIFLSFFPPVDMSWPGLLPKFVRN